MQSVEEIEALFTYAVEHNVKLEFESHYDENIIGKDTTKLQCLRFYKKDWYLQNFTFLSISAQKGLEPLLQIYCPSDKIEEIQEIYLSIIWSIHANE